MVAYRICFNDHRHWRRSKKIVFIPFAHELLINISFVDPDQEKPVGKFCSVIVFWWRLLSLSHQKMGKKTNSLIFESFWHSPPFQARVLDRSRTILFHSSLPGEQLGYRIKVLITRTSTVTNQPKLSRSHTNSADLTSRLPDGRSTRDRFSVVDKTRNANTFPLYIPVWLGEALRPSG